MNNNFKLSSPEQFARDKIKSSIAEACVQNHFELLGYRCDLTGIEHTATSYISLAHSNRNSRWGNYSNPIREDYQKTPDFIISRKHPDGSNTPEAIFVEAKYLSCFNADDQKYVDELVEKYGKFGKLIVYLVAKSWIRGGVPSNDSSIFLIYINTIDKGSRWEATIDKWWQGGSIEFNAPIAYKGVDTGVTFNSVYNDVIKPAIDDLFK